ncbi:MAG TPA: tetratricopeptide repeat protein, partial [Phycisphaerales bacterium]|nr:tetratricopeptide repeat protein [Phycisphaerales bacterium]
PRSRIAMAYEAGRRFDLALPIARELASKGKMETDPKTGRPATVPLMPEMSFHLGWCLLNLNQTEEAIAAYRAGLRSIPDSADAYNSLGILLYRKGDKPGARDAFAEAFRLRPDLLTIKKNIERIDAEIAASGGNSTNPSPGSSGGDTPK